RVDGSGALDAGFPPLELPAFRQAGLSGAGDGGFRLSLGPDRWRHMLWPSPQDEAHRIEWYSASGAPLKGGEVRAPLFGRPVWAEDGEGNFVVSGTGGALRKFLPDGSEDEAFRSPGGVSSVRALP